MEVRTPPVDVAPYVTQAVAAHLQNGQLQLTPAAYADRPIIDESEAVAQAAAYLRTFAQFRMDQIRSEHGRPISLEELSPATRPYFVQTPFGPLPYEAHVADHKRYGPFFAVPILDRSGEQVAVLSISAFNTDVAIEDGRLRLPAVRGNDYRFEGVPAGGPALPLSPEGAIKFASTQTGALAAALPTLHRFSITHVAHIALWQIRLNHPVSVRVTGSGEALEIQSLFVDRAGALFIGRKPDEFTTVTYSLDGEKHHTAVATAGPLAFDQVDLQKGGN